MRPKINKDERRKFMGGVLAACLGATVSLGISKKAHAQQDEQNQDHETLYRKTPHVEDYLRTLED